MGVTAGKNRKEEEASDAGMAAADKTKRWLLTACLHIPSIQPPFYMHPIRTVVVCLLLQ